MSNHLVLRQDHLDQQSPMAPEPIFPSSLLPDWTLADHIQVQHADRAARIQEI
jgi:hypothetical protein